MRTDFTADYLRERLDYDGETGIFTWRISVGTTKVGAVAGSKSVRGYWRICINGYPYLAHRLAWLFVHGVWPDGLLDHINRIKDDNRIDNIRCATNSQNNQNRPTFASNTSGYQGVRKHPKCGRWQARLQVGGKTHYLGYHDTAELAHAAYLRAASELHTHNPLLSGRPLPPQPDPQ